MRYHQSGKSIDWDLFDRCANLISQPSPYRTPIISISIGSGATIFQVHSGVLSESPVLYSRSRSLSLNPFSLPHIDPSVFELALCYLYGRKYEEYSSPSNPALKGADAKPGAFRRHVLLYCFAQEFQLDRLTALTIENIEHMGQVDYQAILSVAKQAYQQLPGNESWFRSYFKEESKRAFAENLDLRRKSWVLDIFKEGNGDLA